MRATSSRGAFDAGAPPSWGNIAKRCRAHRALLHVNVARRCGSDASAVSLALVHGIGFEQLLQVVQGFLRGLDERRVVVVHEVLRP